MSLNNIDDLINSPSYEDLGGRRPNSPICAYFIDPHKTYNTFPFMHSLSFDDLDKLLNSFKKEDFDTPITGMELSMGIDPDDKLTWEDIKRLAKKLREQRDKDKSK